MSFLPRSVDLQISGKKTMSKKWTTNKLNKNNVEKVGPNKLKKNHVDKVGLYTLIYLHML